jgi:acyl-CoA reductase-like NAD-dependent aldehyde dehydrogenase
LHPLESAAFSRRTPSADSCTAAKVDRTAGVDYHVPFGGRKGSSYGPREQGRYAAEFYTVVKTAYMFDLSKP